ncbi:hypothetical protein DFH11DRAFT_1221789 [Phellopilus nigrolimitatus]|nr:hypothetical protein DFH11DRAFT_1221789 [Phellopilus nigrolimitatus]
MAAPAQTLSPKPQFPQIVLATFRLPTNSVPPRFHWIFYVAQPSGVGGTKMHAIQAFGEYEFAAVDYTLETSQSITHAAVIGHLQHHTLGQLRALLEQIPLNAVPPADVGIEPRFGCRVWIREALRRMHAAGIISCPDVHAMMEEMREHSVATHRKYYSQSFTPLTLMAAENSA